MRPPELVLCVTEARCQMIIGGRMMNPLVSTIATGIFQLWQGLALITAAILTVPSWRTKPRHIELDRRAKRGPGRRTRRDHLDISMKVIGSSLRDESCWSDWPRLSRNNRRYRSNRSNQAARTISSTRQCPMSHICHVSGKTETSFRKR